MNALYFNNSCLNNVKTTLLTQITNEHIPDDELENRVSSECLESRQTYRASQPAIGSCSRLAAAQPMGWIGASRRHAGAQHVR